MTGQETTAGARPVRAPHGTMLTARGWQTEAPLRMLQNNLDPEVAEHPDRLVVYGGTGKAARDWPSLRRDRPHADRSEARRDAARADPAARSASANARVGAAGAHRQLEPGAADWATWEEFRRLEALGLTMYGQMTAGSWIYIGTQGILQGTYETFAAVAAKRFGGTLAGTITLTGGLGGMGGAQPLAVTMNDGVAICIDVRRVAHPAPDRTPLPRRVDCTRWTRRCGSRSRPATHDGRSRSGCSATPRRWYRRCWCNDAPIDIVTDQTSAHDPLSYLPIGVEFDDWHDYATRKPEEFTGRARASMARQVEPRWWASWTGAPRCSTTATRSAARPSWPATNRAFDFPGFVPAYIRPLFCEGEGPVPLGRAVGRPGGHRPDRQGGSRSVPREHFAAPAGSRWPRSECTYQGLPARICWLGYGERDRAGLAFNDLVASGADQRPDRHRPRPSRLPDRSLRRTGRPRPWLDGSDAIADWPLLNAMVNDASGASWVSIHHGGGVGIGRSIHAGQVTVADGTALAAEKLERVLTNDPAMGVIRHVDAGYDRAAEVASDRDVAIPMRPGHENSPNSVPDR